MEEPRGRARAGLREKGFHDPTRLPSIIYSTKIGVASRLSKKWQNIHLTEISTHKSGQKNGYYMTKKYLMTSPHASPL